MDQYIIRDILVASGEPNALLVFRLSDSERFALLQYMPFDRHRLQRIPDAWLRRLLEMGDARVAYACGHMDRLHDIAQSIHPKAWDAAMKVRGLSNTSWTDVFPVLLECDPDDSFITSIHLRELVDIIRVITVSSLAAVRRLYDLIHVTPTSHLHRIPPNCRRRR